MIKKQSFKGFLILLFLLTFCVSPTSAENQIPVTAPMTTDLAGRSGNIASVSVFRILCPSINSSGTGFLHKSGVIITAGHVVSNCNAVIDDKYDLALLRTKSKIKGKSLPICSSESLLIGSQISTWGYPTGYTGGVPLLTSGYLSGIQSFQVDSGQNVRKWVVNAAFNSGNSGGPLLEIENGEVIGVVSSKLAPIPKFVESALNALKNSKGGFMYTKTNPDGTEEPISQAQIVELVLQYLRSQTQLVIGYAATLDDLKKFLISNGIEP
jgi:hypothetical protein